MRRGVIYAVLAALTFGASTPFAKQLVGELHPLMLAALLYLGSGLGLSACLLARRALGGGAGAARLVRADLPWLAAIVATGGVLGPVLLLAGLRGTPASSASLLLNLEMVFTFLVAWIGFREHVDRRLLLGAALIVAGSVLLAWREWSGLGVPWAALAIAAACLCWALDNNLTRKLAGGDALQIAALKGLAAGLVNLVLALGLGLELPGAGQLLAAGALGFVGYGLSLVLFVLALRHLGTARTGAYFALAPFAGAALSMLLFAESPPAAFWLAAALMGGGIWLHLAERHVHEHEHPAVTHSHAHVHDEHHRHRHAMPQPGAHTHSHTHEPQRHSHPHAPDIDHRHRH
jgi:drug/metabolite transporter (DMT)-like permease